MISFKKNRKILLIFSLIFPTIFALNLLLPSVQGGPYVPEDHANNGWHWEIDVGDEIYFEGEFILTNVSTGEVYMMFRDISIYNITSIENVTISDFYGVNEVSQVNATQCYYNITTEELETYDNSQEFALFGYNSSGIINHIYRAGRNGIPFVLPLNGSNNIQVDILEVILNESFYSTYYEMAFNAFDYSESDPGSKRIYFYNSTEHYFIDCYYYDNGTLDSASAYLLANMGEGPVYINATMKQVFDTDITDEIEWGVNVGDKLYYDLYEGSDWIEDAEDAELEIVNISKVQLEKTNNGFSSDPIIMTFEVVYANVSIWNGTEYEQVESNFPLGMANNFYPQYFDIMTGTPYVFLYPSNLVKEDFEFMWNNDTLRIWNAPFDEIYYYENAVFEAFLTNSTGSDFAEIVIDPSTGVTQSYLLQNEGFILYFQIKSMTLVDWSVNNDDVIYYKQNGDESYDQRVTILGTYTVFVNMTELFLEFSSGGFDVTLPSGQPEFQFFSYIYALIEEWNPFTESWDYDDDRPFAIANTYWPISPLTFEMGAPLLMPEGTTSSELTDLFDVYGAIYDNITYGPGEVILTNTTLDRTLNFYFDEVSGRVTMIYGWASQPGPAPEWNYMSIYPKYYEFCPSGATASFTQQNDFSMDITVDVEFDVSVGGPGVEYIYAQLPYNPVNISLPNGTALAYFDQLIINNMLVDGNISMTITLPSSLDLNDIEVFFFAYNMSGTEEWDEAPPEVYNAIIYDYGANSLTLEVPAWGPMSVISAMSYNLIETEEEPIIPGYNPLILVISIIIMAGFLIKKKLK
jgi:hypothetical protein